MLYYPHMDWRYEDILFGRNFNDLFHFLFQDAPRKVKKMIDSIYDHFEPQNSYNSHMLFTTSLPPRVSRTTDPA